MNLTKNKKYQYLFYIILLVYSFFNAGNSNLLIQINFLLLSGLFFFCVKEKNYYLHCKYFYEKNKIFIKFYFLFLIYSIFQIIPFPIEFLEIFSPVKYDYLNKLKIDLKYSSISLSPYNSFFQFLNFLSLFILILVLKMIFYTERHKFRFYFFISIIGFLSSFFAIILYLNGNPDLFFLKKSFYTNSSTGFFINRTVFSVFLLFCLISCLEILKKDDLKKYFKKSDIFFTKIYVRLFTIFITIGIITSFSRIGNFLFLITIIIYSINYFLLDGKNKSFRNILLLIILFDILILGFYFGATQLLDRFSLLSEEFNILNKVQPEFSRFETILFGINEIKNFLFFGYGMGSFEVLFKLKYLNNSSLYADHAHSDLVEFVGELGLFGSILIILSIFKFFAHIKILNHINFILILYLFTILSFDFSLHVPLVQILFIIFFLLNNKSIQSN
tara:strand:- start:186 stop:1520 length:1335 start_codon:yes stop_codon:yes gene_type:complete